MAQVKFGALVTDIRGKVGGHVFQGNGLTTTMRTGYAGPGQFAQRDRQFKSMNYTIDRMWEGYTDIERNAWNVLSQQLPRQDNFGNQNFLTGQNLHRRNYTAFYGSGQTGTIDLTIAIPEIIDRKVFYIQLSWTMDRIIITWQDYNVPVASMLYALPVANRRLSVEREKLPFIYSWLGTAQNFTDTYDAFIARFPNYKDNQPVQFAIKYVNEFGFSTFKQVYYNIPV